jgi:hypothetical protein
MVNQKSQRPSPEHPENGHFHWPSPHAAGMEPRAFYIFLQSFALA